MVDDSEITDGETSPWVTHRSWGGAGQTRESECADKDPDPEYTVEWGVWHGQGSIAQGEAGTLVRTPRNSGSRWFSEGDRFVGGLLAGERLVQRTAISEWGFPVGGPVVFRNGFSGQHKHRQNKQSNKAPAFAIDLSMHAFTMRLSMLTHVLFHLRSHERRGGM